MQQRPLGDSGLLVSELGFGCGAVGGLMVRGDAAEQREVIARALEAGVTYFDTAQMYGDGASERNLGRALTDLGAWGRVVVGTKLMVPRAQLGDAAASVRRSLETSLQRLGRDSVDLIQLHGRVVAPDAAGDSPTASEVTEIIADALNGLVEAGLARRTGFTGLGGSDAVMQVVRSGRLNSVQAYFNALNPSAGYPGRSGGGQDFSGVIDAAASAGMGVINIRALAAGALSGSEQRAQHASNMAAAPPMAAGGDFSRDVARARELTALAHELGIETTTELGFRFCLAKPGISTVLIGFSNGEQLEQALAWVERGPLTPEAVQRIVAQAGQDIPGGTS